jgi:hypothetical protein
MNLPRSLATLLLLLPLTAQEPQAPPASASPSAPSRPKEPGPTVTLAFRGGTLAEFVAQLRQAEPRANIVMDPAVAKAVLPEMDLRGAGLDQALDSACLVAASDRRIHLKDFRGAGEPVFTLVALTKAPEANRDILLRTEVFGLGRLTDADAGVPNPLSPATILSAVEAAVGEPKLTMLRFHQESNLMFARGTVEQLQVVQNVLMNLERDMTERRNRKQAQDGRAHPPAVDPTQKPKESK